MSAPRWLGPWFWPLAGLMLAAAVRLPFLVHPSLDSDMALTGLMAMHILRGELPVFFWGQPYCGSIEAFLAAPIFAVLGPSERALMLAPLSVSLVFVWLCYLAARDMWGRRAGLAAMLLAAVPPFYFAWASVLPRAAYIEIPTLSLLLVWLAFRIVHRRATAWLYFAYGLTAGVGVWTHFLIIYALLPTAVYIWLADKRLLLKRQMLTLLAGFTLGSLPLWLYNLIHPLATFSYLAQPKPTVGAWPAFWGLISQAVPTLLGAYLDRSFQPVVPLFSYLSWALGLALLVYVVYLCRPGLKGLRRLSVAQDHGGLLWLGLIASLALVVTLSGEPAEATRRHYVPLYVAMFPLAGLAYTRLAEHRRTLAGVMLAFMLASNLAGLVQINSLTNPALRESYQAQHRSTQRLLAQLERWGVRRAYTLEYRDAMRLTFAARERIIFARPFYSRYPAYTRAVDAAPRTAWVLSRDSTDMKGVLETLGAAYRLEWVDEFWCFLDIKPPPHNLAEVRPAGWRARASGRGQDAPLAWDRRADTRWSPLAFQEPGQYLQLDLGRVVPAVGMLHLHSGNYGDIPRLLKIEVSLDGRQWQEVARLGLRPGPFHWTAGKVMTNLDIPREDVYFPPRPVRFIRLTQTGRAPKRFWSLAELAVYQTAGPAQPRAAAAAVAAIRRRGPRNVYADAFLAANLPLALTPPKLARERFPEWTAGLKERSFPVPALRALVALPLYASAGARRIWQAAGVSYQEARAGGYHLFWSFAPRPAPRPLALPPGSTAAASAGRPELALDHKLATRWTTGRARRAGDFYELRLPAPMDLAGLTLTSPDSPQDLSERLRLEASADGTTWQPLQPQTASLGPFVFGGDLLLTSRSSRLLLAFQPTEVRALRLTLLQGHPYYNWSFNEIGLLAPQGPVP